MYERAGRLTAENGGFRPGQISALARFGGGFVAAGTHSVALFDAETKKEVGKVSVDLASAKGGDLNGYVWAELASPVTLATGKKYFLASEEDGTDVLYEPKVWMQSMPGLLTGLAVPVSKPTAGGEWEYGPGGGGGGGKPIVQTDLHFVVSESTSECFDTVKGHVDLWDCVADGHNELYNYSASTGLIKTGPNDADKGGHCVSGKSMPRLGGMPTTITYTTCDEEDPLQKFEHTPTGHLQQRGGLKMCLTAGIKRENAGVTLVACAADNKAQQWRFTRAPPVGLTPGGKFIDAPPCIST